MTAAQTIYSTVTARGFSLRADGGDLKLIGTNPPADLVHDLRTAKPALLIFLADLRDFFDERAAIRQYDGAMTRPEAEAAARCDVIERYGACPAFEGGAP